MATHRHRSSHRRPLVASGGLLVLWVVGSGIYLQLSANDEGDLADAENRQTWVLQEELTFPASAGVPPIATGAVLVLEASPDGTLYMGDQQNHRILVFDSAGTSVRSIGRDTNRSSLPAAPRLRGSRVARSTATSATRAP